MKRPKPSARPGSQSLTDQLRDKLDRRIKSLPSIVVGHELPSFGSNHGGGVVIDDTELGGYPLYIPKQEAILVGRVDGDELDSEAAYYLHSRGGVFLGDYADGDDAFVPRHAVECDSHVMSEHVRALDESGVVVTRSSIGDALADAHELSQDGVLGREQAHVYALRDLHGFSRGETATILNVSPSTVDSHLYRAREQKESAESFVDTHDRLAEGR